MKEKVMMVWVCASCGSEDVQHAMWVDMNTNEVHDIFGSWCHGDNSFCNGCGENSELVEREKSAPKTSKKAAPKKGKR